MTYFAAAQRRCFITVKRRATGADAHGQPSSDYSVTVGQYWAQVDPLGSATARAEQRSGDARTSAAVYVFRIGGLRADITADDRIVTNGSTFAINQVRPDHRTRRWTDLVATEGGV